MVPVKELIKVELIDGSINSTNNLKIEGPIVEYSPHCTVKSNCTAMFSEDLDKIIKYEKDLLDDCTWESTMEIQKTMNQNTIMGPFNQNVSNCNFDEITTYRNAFPCQICKESFPLHYQLKNHMMNHKKPTQAYKDVNKCKICGKQFKLNFSYNRHAEKCHLFKCEICGKFFNKTEYSEHITTHGSGSSGNKTDFIPNLKLCKLNGVWKSKPNYKCNSCFEKFYTKNNLIQHMKRHNNDDTMNEDCLMYNTSVTELETPRNLFKCQKCNRNFDQKFTFDYHLSHCSANSSNIRNKFRGNFKTNVGLFFCKSCGIGFHNRLVFNNHRVLGCKIHCCIHCGRDFTNKNSWLKHMSEHQNLKQCVKSNINRSKTHNQNMNNSESRPMKINFNPDERLDQIDAVNRNLSTIQTIPHNLKMNNCNPNIKKEKIVTSKIFEKDCVDQISAANSNKSTLYTLPRNLIMNGCSPSKEKYLCSNTTERNNADQINATNYYESTSQIVPHNITINYSSLNIKKERIDDSYSQQINAANSYELTLPPVSSNSIVNGISPSLNNNETMSTLTTKRMNSDLTSEENNSNITEINNSDQINAVKKCETIKRPTSLGLTMYDHSLNIKEEKIESLGRKNVTEIKRLNHIVNSHVPTVQISNTIEFSNHLVVKQEHALNDSTKYPLIVRETVYLSIRKSSAIEKLPYISTDYNLKSTCQINFKFICKICLQSSFTDIHTFALHMSDHAECSMHECIVCDETFTTVIHWKNHMTYHQQEVNLNLSKTQVNRIEFESNNLINTSNSESMIPKVSSTPYRNKQSTISKLISEFKKSTKRQYHCDMCSKIFYSHLTLTAHQAVHNNSRPFSCKYSDKTFSSKDPFINHEKSHNSDKNYVLNENKKECEPIETLNRIEFVGNSVSTFSCKYCERKFSSRGSCTNHEKSHTFYINKSPLYNIEDEEHINSKSIESQNNTSIVNNHVEKFQCNYCDKIYLSKGALTKHEKSHNSDKNIVNTANKEECGNINNIKTPNDIKIVGKSINIFFCQYCERTFSSKGPCTNHEKSHTTHLNYKVNLYSIEEEAHNISESIESQKNTNILPNYVDKFPCNYCDKTYLSKGARTKHEKSHNSDRNSFFKTQNEEECENMENIEALNNIKISGNSVGSISCKYCERTFSSRGPCTNHEKSHTTSLNYLNLYSIEDKEHIKFRSIKPLLTTEKEEHGPIYNLDKIQIENGNVDYHENKNKVNKFVCFICEKTFTKHFDLTSHIILWHKVDPNSHEQLANLNNKMSSINSITSNNARKNKLTKKKKELVVNSRFKNKPVSCTVCKKHFVHYGALFSHMKTHSGLKPYKCQYCDKKFNMKGPWTLHEKTHKFGKEFLSNKVKIEPNEEKLVENGDNSEFVPKICENSSVNINENKQNRMWFVCDVCDKKFSTPFKLIIHRRTSCLVEPYVCKICNRSYTVRHRWNRHLKSHYIRNKLVKNSKKNRQTNNLKLDKSKLFIKSVQPKNQYKCSYCKKEYCLISYWKKHLSLSKECRRHCKRGLPEFMTIQAKEKFLQTESLQYQCHICKKTYSSAYNRKIHLMNIHNSSEDSGTLCKICGKNYSNKANLNRHYSVVHTKDNTSISCFDCGITFKDVYSYQEHIKLKCFKLQQNNKSTCNTNRNAIHHTVPISVVKYSCKICKMEFADNIMLQRHLKIHAATMYKCKDCNQLFKSNIILSKHILENHDTKISLNKSKDFKNNAIQNTSSSTNDLLNKCEICLKVLKTPKYLSHHMRLHSGIKPFKCDYCSMAFRFDPNLKIHLKRYHSEETNMS